MLNEKLSQFLLPPEKESVRRVIYLTGLAGSGKTSVSKILSERLGAHLIPEFVEPIPDSVMSTRATSPFEQKLEAELWALNQFTRKNAMIGGLSGTIIVDRTWVDVLPYALVYGQDVLETIIEKVAGYEWHTGFYVVLYAEEGVIKQRLQNKFSLSERDWSESWGPYIHHLRNSVINLTINAGMFTIDTSRLSPEEVSAIIESKYKEIFG